MPTVPINGVELFYELHCSKHGALPEEQKGCACHDKGTAHHVLLIMGFQARGEGWRYNLDALLSFKPPSNGEVICCWFDNRGVGASSHPDHKADYSTAIMAKDALGLMDYLGWEKAHMFGHSMGGMIACKVASMAPDRVLSLALISVTGGRWQALKSIIRKLPGHIKHGAVTAKTAEAKARLTLYAHFSRMWLKENTENTHRRKEQLIEEYMADQAKDDYSTGRGTEGQLRAVWGHRVSNVDIAKIRAGGFPVLVIHGRKDVIANISYAENLSRKLNATSLFTNAGHFITRESEAEVNHALVSLLQRVIDPLPDSARAFGTPSTRPNPSTSSTPATPHTAPTTATATKAAPEGATTTSTTTAYGNKDGIGDNDNSENDTNKSRNNSNRSSSKNSNSDNHNNTPPHAESPARQSDEGGNPQLAQVPLQSQGVEPSQEVSPSPSQSTLSRGEGRSERASHSEQETQLEEGPSPQRRAATQTQLEPQTKAKPLGQGKQSDARLSGHSQRSQDEEDSWETGEQSQVGGKSGQALQPEQQSEAKNLEAGEEGKQAQQGAEGLQGTNGVISPGSSCADGGSSSTQQQRAARRSAASSSAVNTPQPLILNPDML